MYAISPLPLVIRLIFLILVGALPPYLLYTGRWAIQMRSPKNAALLIIVPTLIMLPLQVWLSYDYSAYESGSFRLGYYVQELGPNETAVIRSISNWHTIDTLEVHVYQDLNVTIYAVDENLPDVRYLEQNCSYAYFRLPYLYTNFPLIANWSIYLSNPNPNETITVALIHWELGSAYLTDTSLATLYRYPSKALMTLWVAAALFAVVTESREEEKNDTALNLRFLAGVCIIVYLIALAPIGGWVAMAIDLLGFFIASFMVCAIFAYKLRSSTPRSPAKKTPEIQDDAVMVNNQEDYLGGS